MREEFEKLPSIKVFLPSFKFNEEINEYVRSGLYHQPEYSLGFFNGAWYAYQEQQKKIDIGKELQALYEKEIKQLECGISKAILAIYEGDKENALCILKELLK